MIYFDFNIKERLNKISKGSMIFLATSQRSVAYDDMGYSYMSIIYKITYDHILTHICVFLAHIRVPIYRTGI